MTTTRHILSTFDLKPTTAPDGAKPDELMINWTTLPAGSTASLYMPGVSADDILTEAAKLNGYQPFKKIDANTVGCEAQGISYVPIPKVPGNLAGLMDVELPAKVKAGNKFTVTVNQLTNQSASIPIARGPGGTNLTTSFVPPDRIITRPIAWRKVAGTFKLAILVKSEKDTLPTIERNLSLLRWIFETIPKESRWYPIFERYLGTLALQVSGLGGDPAKIAASGTGVGPGGKPARGAGHGGGVKHEPGHGHRPRPEYCRDDDGFAGKIEGLIFDHFGDFEGFILETESGERLHFHSRERGLQNVVERAWAARLRVTVIPEDEDEHHLRRIVLHLMPPPFEGG